GPKRKQVHFESCKQVLLFRLSVILVCITLRHTNVLPALEKAGKKKKEEKREKKKEKRKKKKLVTSPRHQTHEIINPNPHGINTKKLSFTFAETYDTKSKTHLPVLGTQSKHRKIIIKK
ncbi:hypothetical protein PanWU01x14_177850, partial [Parasponia andersonii]